MNGLPLSSLGFPAAAAVAVLIVILLMKLSKSLGASVDPGPNIYGRGVPLPPWLSALVGLGIAAFVLKVLVVVLKGIGGVSARP
jgi:hypothetical protein